MTLKKLKYFLERAVECERLADIAVDPHNRELLLSVASRWRAMAEDEQVHNISQHGDGEPLSSQD